MSQSHRTSVLVTSCLKTPVDPRTKVPVASYERERVFPCARSRKNNRDDEKEMGYSSGSELGAGGTPPGKEKSPLLIKDYRVTEDHIDLREFYFSNEEYYRKLEQLKRAHLRTMAELELMYCKKLRLKGEEEEEEEEEEDDDNDAEEAARLSWGRSGPLPLGTLKKSHSAHELRRGRSLVEVDREADSDTEKGLLLSPKEHIKNMWHGFSVDRLSPGRQHASLCSLHSQPGERRHTAPPKAKAKGQRSSRRKGGDAEEGEGEWQPRVTVPKPFQMTVREAIRKKKGVKTRAEIERENEDLRRQLEELTECQRKFRASPVPAHVRLPLFEELREREGQRRRLLRDSEPQHLHASQRPFSFLERERLKKEQREAQLRDQALLSAKEEAERRRRPFRAKPVPRVVKEAASGEAQKEELLYRAIKMQMRAKEMLNSSSMPASMLAHRLSERRAQKDAQDKKDRDDRASHQPKINAEVPDFDTSYKRFQQQLASRRDVRPVTACEPFQLRTAGIRSHRERVLADIEAGRLSPRPTRWPFSSPVDCSSPRTPSSSLCSSLSGSQEILSTKITEAAKKRQEAVRKVLEQRKKAEEEEDRWRERQRQKERKLQKVVTKRAQANDPHETLAQTCQSKLKQFRKQDMERRREYREEMREIQARVKGRPLLLEQVAQKNAKQAAEKRYTDKLRGCGLTEAFITSKAPRGSSPRLAARSPTLTPSPSPSPARYGEDDGADILAETLSTDSSLADDYPEDYEEYDQDNEAGPKEKERSKQSDEKEDKEMLETDQSDHDSCHDDGSYFDEDNQGDCYKDSNDVINRRSRTKSSSPQSP